MIFSCVIPVKNIFDPLLGDLVKSIRSQNFPQDQIEIIPVTEGDSESAKAMGIRMATGYICGMFCADNYITDKELFNKVYAEFTCGASAVYPKRYAYVKDDNSLNRYFSLIGGNDPVCYYLGKNDRDPHVSSLKRTSSYQPSYGCNGFFYLTNLIKKTNLDHYYPMDNAMEVEGSFVSLDSDAIWHRTSDSLIPFLKKRYRYARDLYCDRTDRRWKMLDTKEDFANLFLFIVSTVTVIPCLITSARGFLRVRNWAWFWHYPVCLGFLITYGVLVCRNILRVLSSSRRLEDLKLLKTVLTPSANNHSPTTKLSS